MPREIPSEHTSDAPVRDGIETKQGPDLTARDTIVRLDTVAIDVKLVAARTPLPTFIDEIFTRRMRQGVTRQPSVVIVSIGLHAAK